MSLLRVCRTQYLAELRPATDHASSITRKATWGTAEVFLQVGEAVGGWIRNSALEQRQGEAMYLLADGYAVLRRTEQLGESLILRVGGCARQQASTGRPDEEMALAVVGVGHRQVGQQAGVAVRRNARLACRNWMTSEAFMAVRRSGSGSEFAGER